MNGSTETAIDVIMNIEPLYLEATAAANDDNPDRLEHFILTEQDAAAAPVFDEWRKWGESFDSVDWSVVIDHA